MRALAIVLVLVASVLAVIRFLGADVLVLIELCVAFLLIGMGLADGWRVWRKDHHSHGQPDT